LTRFLGCLVVLLLGTSAAVELNPPEVQELVDGALEHAYRQEYDAAFELLTRLSADFPDNPAADFFMGAYWQLYMFDHGTDTLEPVFLDYMERSRNRAREILDQEENARAHLYVGATRVYEAVYFGWKGDYWQTLRAGLKAPPELSLALQQDSMLDDACLGLGVNEYFHYAAGRYLVGLNLFGSLDKAVRLVRRAAEGDGYFTITARYTLSWMMTQEKRFAEAHELLDNLLVDYPGNRLFRKQSRDTYFAEKEYAAAVKVGEALDQELQEQQPDNWAGKAENDLSLVRNYTRLDDRESARQRCDSVISYESPAAGGVRLSDYIREARALRRKL
jgi:hypothetical protein